MTQISCNAGLTDVGQACVEAFLVTNFLIAVPTTDSTGVSNEIDLTVTLDKAYFDARFNDTDKSKRWQRLPDMLNIANKRATPEFKTWNNGSKSLIRQGVKEFMGIAINDAVSGGAPQMEGKLNALNGQDVSFFSVDVFGNILGKVGSDSTHLAPVQAESSTIYAVHQQTEDKDVAQNQFGFDFALTEKDQNLRMIKSSEMTYNLNSSRGIIDVTSVITNKTVTGFTAKLVTDGGTILNPVLVKGLVSADFISSVTSTVSKLRDVTDAADLAITSVTESPAGVYTFVTPNSTGDTVILKPKKNGFDFSAVEAAAIIYP